MYLMLYYLLVLLGFSIKMNRKFIVRDISWLSFNGRVLQEAADTNVPLKERIRFLGIFSNNLDEFFRVRVATLSRMIEFGKKAELRMHLEKNPKKIMEEIHDVVLLQQNEFNRIWIHIQKELKKNHIFIRNDKQLNFAQRTYVEQYFEQEVRGNIIPLMIESIKEFPNLHDKSLYLAVSMTSSANAYDQKYAIIEIPTKVLNRFVIIPSIDKNTYLILLEDVVRVNLKYIFRHLNYDQFEAWIFKVTRDAELDIDNEVTTNLIQKIEVGLKKRRRGKAVRLVYDKEIDIRLLNYLKLRLNLSNNDNLIPGGRIHNFNSFMNFPNVFHSKKSGNKLIAHPELTTSNRLVDVILKKDILLVFPYHSFDNIIDLLREAAIDPTVVSIKISAYRLAKQSKIMNALINAARNGKDVTVMLELRARFDEEANLNWKSVLEEEGIKVLIGVPNMKVHAKLCVIKRKVGKTYTKYGFVSTGNLNEQTSKFYIDFCLLTSKPKIVSDLEKMFKYLEHPATNFNLLNETKEILTCPKQLRSTLYELIDFEIKEAKLGNQASIILKMNSLSDEILIEKLHDASKKGVSIQLIVRGILCMLTESNKGKHAIEAISIVDEYLEHARAFYFYHKGAEKMYISSADWMVRNLDHRVEATCPIHDPQIKKDLLDILKIQLKDTIKARILDNRLLNTYVTRSKQKPIRSQHEILKYLSNKKSPIN